MAKGPGRRRIKRREPRPPPRCKAILLCDHVILDQRTGKHSVIGIVDRFLVDEFPALIPNVEVFLYLIEGIGVYDIVLEVHDLREDRVVGRGPGLEIRFAQKLAKITLIASIPHVTLRHPGTYDVIAFANEQEIDRQQFVASRKEDRDEAQEEVQ